MVLISVLLWCLQSLANDLRPLSQNPPAISQTFLGYRQQFNNYVWQFNGSHSQSTQRWRINFAEQFHSSMLLLGAKEGKWKDDQNLKFDVSYLLHPALSLQTQMTSLVFNDKQSGLNNDIRTHLGSVGLEYTPGSRVAARASAGPKWDVRLNQYDAGLNYNLEVQAKDINLQDYSNDLQFKFEQDRFPVRRNHDLNLHYLVKREFTPGTSDSLNITTSDRRVDNYLSAAGDIESLREGIKGLTNNLSYHIARGMDFKVRSSLLFKNVQVSYAGPAVQQKERRRNDQRINNEIGFLIKRHSYRAYTLLSYWTQQQRYDIRAQDPKSPFSGRTAFITPDNESNRLNLVALAGIRLSAADSLYGYFSTSRFQYDTPDTNNFDDRDELRMNSRLVYAHYFSPFLKAEMQVTLNLYHMVYIFGERSADNNWNRILRFSPVISFTPNEDFRFHQAFEVLANYVDYDFENPQVQTKSFVFRKFALNDSLQWHVTGRSAVFLDYRLQMEENGQLLWDAWAERVLLSRHNQWFHLSWKYTLKKGLTVAPGYTYYRRDEWRHRSDAFGVDVREKAGTHLSHGPVLRFSYAVSQKLHILFDGVRYKVQPIGQNDYYTNTLELSMTWLL